MNSSSSALVRSNADFMSRVYFWMMIGLAISGAVAFWVSSTPAVIEKIYSNSFILIGLLVLQVGAVIFLSAAINRMNALTATLIYLAYSALTGLTFGGVLLIYTKQSIAEAFFITSFAFIGLSAFGYLTKKDLGPIGTFCMTGLYGLFGFILISIFFPSIRTSAVSLTVNIAALVIFAGLTAYDTQRIKSFNVSNSGEIANKAAISGALMLYLDFINMFLWMLSLLNGRR